MKSKIGKLATAVLVGIGAATPAAGPALAVGPGNLYGNLYYGSTLLASASIKLTVSPSTYTITVNDLSSIDGVPACVRVYANNGNAPSYCDSYGAGPTLYTIYYDWNRAYLNAGTATTAMVP